MIINKGIHRILLSVGIALGVIATGTTVNAKAQQVNPSNKLQTNQYSNNSQSSFRTARLVNQLEQRPTLKSNLSTGINTNTSSTYENNQNNNHSLNCGTTNLSHLSYVHDFNHGQQNSHEFHVQLNHVYHHILSSSSSSNNSTHQHDLKIGVQSHKKNTNHSIQMNNISKNNHAEYIHNWFQDNLSRRNLRARDWVSWHESNHRWNVLSYGGVCVGYFQLNPHYLGYRNGHVDLRPQHQVKVADRYVKKRYGNWVNAQRFWAVHHWY